MKRLMIKLMKKLKSLMGRKERSRGGSSFQQMVDVGKRFGDKQRWGVRVMADNIDGETAVKGEKLTQRDVFVNIDQKTTNSKTNILAGYNYNKQQGMVSYGVGFDSSLTSLPKPLDGSKTYGTDFIMNQPCTVPTISCGCPVETYLCAF